MLTVGCSEPFATRMAGPVNRCLSRLLRNFKSLALTNPCTGLILVLFTILDVGTKAENVSNTSVPVEKGDATAGRQGVSNAANGSMCEACDAFRSTADLIRRGWAQCVLTQALEYLFSDLR